MTKDHFRIARVLEDGQQVTVSILDDLSQARRLVASLNEYWPGYYVVLGPDSQLAPLPGCEGEPRENQVEISVKV